MISAAAIKAHYRRAMDVVGETVLIRRYTGTGAGRPVFDVAVRARVTGYEPDELVGSIRHGDRKLIVLAEDLIAGGLALPVTDDDKAVVRGQELAIMAPDDSTRRLGGELIAYELTVRG
jgi:hypothetical protein